jgi:hypothetical protein
MKFSSLRTLLGERLGSYSKYYPGLDDFLGSRNASLILCDLMGWRGKGKDPDGWIYKSNVELTLETGLSRDQQARAIKLLLKRGILKKELRGIPAVNNFLVIENVLQSQWFDWCRDKPQSVVAKSYNSVPDSLATITSLPDEATNIPTGADKYSNRKPIKSSARARMEEGILSYKNRKQSEASGLTHISNIIPSGDNSGISGTS